MSLYNTYFPKSKLKCIKKNCGRKQYSSHNLCRYHHIRSKYFKGYKNHILNIGKKCTIKNCNNNAFCKGVCKKHYWRWRRYKNYDKPEHYNPGFRIERRCNYCNKIMLIIPSRNKYERVYCCNKHQVLFTSGKHKGENAYNWINSGRSKNGTEYWHVRNSTGKWVREHRVICENMIGRKLKKNEVVHHKNGIKDDNRPENLAVLTRDRHPGDTYIKILQERIRELEKKLE